MQKYILGALSTALFNLLSTLLLKYVAAVELYEYQIELCMKCVELSPINRLVFERRDASGPLLQSVPRAHGKKAVAELEAKLLSVR